MKIYISLLLLIFTSANAVAQCGLKDIMGKYFQMGVAVNVEQAAGRDTAGVRLICENYDNVVAENCMKAEVIQPYEGHFFWDDADRFVSFAEEHGMTVLGHCLVWHSQAPDWLFVDSLGNLPSREVMIQRMRDHIYAVVGRYKGRIEAWDVINEAFEDDGSMRNTGYLKAIGPEYFELAFKFAHEADPDARLYYNDYSMANPAKRDAVCRMVRRLKAAGCRIDGVGMQSHHGMDWPDFKEYERTIDSLAACGVSVMISELDLNMLPKPKNFEGAGVEQRFEYEAAQNPYVNGLPRKMQKQIDRRWMEIFRIISSHRSQISRVAMWGVSDGDSWMNDWPVPGRTAYPLLFDRQHKAKPVVKKILKMFKP